MVDEGPNNAAAITGLAGTYWSEHEFGWGNSGTDYDAKILGPLDRAIALAPDFDGSYSTKSGYLALSQRFDEAVRVATAGLSVNPNSPYLYVDRGEAEISLGRLDEAKSDIQRAIRLSPDDPWKVNWDRQLGNIEFAAGHLEAAIDAYHKVLDAGDRAIHPLRKPRGRLRAPGQDGRGEAIRGRNPSPQSELHRQMASRARHRHSDPQRRSAQGASLLKAPTPYELIPPLGSRLAKECFFRPAHGSSCRTRIVLHRPTLRSGAPCRNACSNEGGAAAR
jgi:tetratricopeptide (TPR) repeat protein